MSLSNVGMPRKAARVYAYVLADDADHYTARELGDGLAVSLAAISGATKYLVQVGMIRRIRRPGDRADSYVIDDDDLWASVLTARSDITVRVRDVLAEGADVLGDTRGGRRLRRSELFFEFLQHDLDGMVERWDVYRKEHGGDEL